MRQVVLVAFGVGSDFPAVNLLAHRVKSALRRRSGHADQFRWPRIRQRTQQDAAHDTEDRGVGSDPERNRECSHGGESEALA